MYELEIAQITDDGKGVAVGPKSELILISGVNESDGVVKIEVKEVLEVTVLAKKISRIKRDRPAAKTKGSVDSPYEMDGEDEDFEDDYEDEDDSD